MPLAITDKDEGVNAQSTFSIIAGDNDGMFEIGTETGIITTRRGLDREINSLYTLVIQATNNGAEQLSGTSTVVISVFDINDHAPVVTSSLAIISVSEDTPVDTVIATITATDDDVGANGEIYFSILSASGGHYGVNVDSGELRTTGVLDRESSDTNHLSIAITDKGNPPLNTTIMITIVLLDVNDNYPTFVDPVTQYDVFMYEFTASENNNIGYVIGFVNATDPDKDDNGDVRYSITISGSPISVDPNSGELTLSTTLDYETKTSHSITVRASDNGQNPRTTDIDVILNVLDYNDNGPVFASDEYTVNFVKTSATGRALVTAIEVREDDTGINGQITLTIIDNDDFNISKQGVITVEHIENLKLGTVILIVLAKDSGVPPRNATARINVTISQGTDISDLIDSDIRFNVKENTTFTAALYTVGYIGNTEGIISFEIVVDNYNELFIINSTTGELFLTSGKVLDRETKDEYLLVIQARDITNDISDLALVSCVLMQFRLEAFASILYCHG